MELVRAARKVLSNVVEIDAALTQLKIVTGATDSEMERFLSNSIQLSKELGQSVTDVLKSIETFSRLGYDLADSTQLAKYANILANVAAVDTQAATTGLTSIIKGFNMDVSNSEHVADVLIEVGQKYAVSAGEMIEAYEKSGAALSAANTSFEKSAGLIAAANSAVQNSSTVGTALKTISARIRGAKTELEELGEDTSDLAQGFSKYAGEIRALTGFDIMKAGSADTYKDLYDIFEGISRVWDDLSETQQARVSEILGGTRQLQVISSIIGNWKDAAGAYASAMESAGTATEANAAYMESIQGKVGEFKAAFQELSTTALDSDLVGGVVEFGTRLLGTLNAIAKVAAAFRGLNSVIAEIAGVLITTNVALALGSLSKRLTKPIRDTVKAVRDFRDAMAAASTVGISKTQFLVSSFGAAKLAIGGVVAALFAVIAISEKLRQRQEELVARSNELTESFREFKAQNESNTETLRGLSDEFETLSAGVDRYGNNISLSANDYERYQEIVSQVIAMSPSLVDGYDAENNALVNKNQLLERAIELQEQEYQAELRRRTTASTISEALGGPAATYDDLVQDTLSSATELRGAVRRLFTGSFGNAISGTTISEPLARQIISALGIENVEQEIAAYLDEHGNWQSERFWNDYAKRVADDIQSGHSQIVASLSRDDLSLEENDALEQSIEKVRSAAVEYTDAVADIEQSNSAVADQLRMVAEGNERYAELSENAKALVSDYANSFTLSDVSKPSLFGFVPDESRIAAAKDQIASFIQKITPEIQELANTGANLKLGFDEDGNELAVREYQERVRDLIAQINAIDDEDMKIRLRAVLQVSEDGSGLEGEVREAVEHVQNLLVDPMGEAAQRFLDGLTIDEAMQMLLGQWCTGELKQNVFQKALKGCESYLGIAADEPKRIKRHNKPGSRLPLVEIGWSEADCRKWCEFNDLLSPIYTTTTRGGCWFCHNQSVDQLRLLRKNYPDYWALMLKWDADSPVKFKWDDGGLFGKADGHTVHDFERRFALEDLGLIPSDRKFRWRMVNEQTGDKENAESQAS